MLTGYTNKILTGEIKTPKDFLHFCLRAFGILAFMRDEPFSPKKDYAGDIFNDCQHDIDYHTKYMHEAEKRMENLLKMSEKDLYKKYVKDNKDSQVDEKKVLEVCEKENHILANFEEKIKNWDCDPKFENIKKFALNQIDISKHDTSHQEESSLKREKITEKNFKTIKDIYFKKLKSNIQWDIDYHKEQMEKAIKRQNESMTFYGQFMQELEKLNK